MSRQTDYQQRRLSMGICAQCGKRPLHPHSKRYCWLCGTKNRTRARKAAGFKRGTFKIARITPETSELRAA